MQVLAPPEENCAAADVFTRDGVFYVRLTHPLAPESLEVALHGIGSRDEALKAAQSLRSHGSASIQP